MPSLYTQRRAVDVVPRRAAPQPEAVASEPRRDLQTALTNSGLQQYWRKFDDIGISKLGQVLKRRGDDLDKLLDLLRPMPGHRVRLLNFIEEERARAHEARMARLVPGAAGNSCAAFHDVGSGCLLPAAAPGKPPATAARPTSATKRGTTATTASGPPTRVRASSASGGRRGAAGAPPPRTAGRINSIYRQPAARPSSSGSGGGVSRSSMSLRPAASETPTNAAAAAEAAVAAATAAAAAVAALRNGSAPPALTRSHHEEGAAGTDAEAEEAAAMAFLRASWARQMLGNDGRPLPLPEEEEEEEEEEQEQEQEQAPSPKEAAGTLGYTMAFEEDDGEADHADKEAAAAAPPISDKENAAVAGGGAAAALALKLPPAPPPPPLAPSNASATAATAEMAAVQQAVRRQLLQATDAPAQVEAVAPPALSAAAASSSFSSFKAGPELLAAKSPRDVPPPGESHLASRRRGQGGKRGDVLSNSMDTYAAQRGVLWRPDKKEVYTSVAFVLQQHIETAGRHLIVRSDAPLAATLSAAPTALPSPIDNVAGSPESNTAKNGAGGGATPTTDPCAAADGKHGSRLPPAYEVASPGLPASVRRSFISGNNSMHGLRYSLELSPVVERRKNEARGDAALGRAGLASGLSAAQAIAAAAAAAGVSHQIAPHASMQAASQAAAHSPCRGRRGGKAGRMQLADDAAGEEQWANEPWAQPEGEEEAEEAEEERLEALAEAAWSQAGAGEFDAAAGGRVHGGMYAYDQYGDDDDDDDDERSADLNDSSIWEGGWRPVNLENGDFSLFDERLHQGGRFAVGKGAGRGLSGVRQQHQQQQQQAIAAGDEAPMRPPDLSTVSNYIRSLTQMAKMGTEASVVALAYIERLVSSGGFPLHAATWRRCALTAWLLAAKMWDDECYENPEFASLFGHDVDDLNALEQRFVAALNYRLGVSPAEYARYYFALRSICQVETEEFALRPLDAELEAKLERRAQAVRGCALGAWADWMREADLSRSV